MAKIIDHGLAGPDDPIYTEGSGSSPSANPLLDQNPSNRKEPPRQLLLKFLTRIAEI